MDMSGKAGYLVMYYHETFGVPQIGLIVTDPDEGNQTVGFWCNECFEDIVDEMDKENISEMVGFIGQIPPVLAN